MDSVKINREGVEKLKQLIPTEEEIKEINEAKEGNADNIPLGSAEAFLLELGSIKCLEARLDLWMFKINFDMMEKDVVDPLSSLKKGIDVIQTNKTFLTIISATLSMGNILNNTNKIGFQLEYLSQLSYVKDTASKSSLLYHITKTVLDIDPKASTFYNELKPLVKVSITDFEELESSLVSMEKVCKQFMGTLKLSATRPMATKFDHDTEKTMTTFLGDAAKRIMAMRRIHQLVINR